VTLCGWKGNRRSGVALAMCHGLSGLSTYGLNSHRKKMSTTPTLLVGYDTFTGALKMQDLTLQDLTMADQTARPDVAISDIEGPPLSFCLCWPGRILKQEETTRK